MISHFSRIHSVPAAAFAIRVTRAAIVLSAAFAARAHADVEYLGLAQLSGETRDGSGDTESPAAGMIPNHLGGISAIEWIGGKRYLLLADKGPGDGDAPWGCRFHEVEIDTPTNRMAEASVRLIKTVPFTDEQGQRLLGRLTPAIVQKAGWTRAFDPEGFRAHRNRLFVADEYGPDVFEFDLNGRRVRELPIPSRFRVSRRSLSGKEEDLQNKSGRQSNGGFEGLAISPDGNLLLAALQRPLIQDSRGKGAPTSGKNVRFLEIDLRSGTTREFLYVLDDAPNGVCEILAVGADVFLVLERDGKGEREARCKKIYRIDLQCASDVSRVDKLSGPEMPAGITPVPKLAFLDLQFPGFALRGPHFPDKPEGLTFGPDLPNGRRLLILSSDNDFNPRKPILFHAFAIDRQDLPEFSARIESR